MVIIIAGKWYGTHVSIPRTNQLTFVFWSGSSFEFPYVYDKKSVRLFVTLAYVKTLTKTRFTWQNTELFFQNNNTWEILRRWSCNKQFKWNAICTWLIRCNYHHVILPLQNSGVSKKSAGTSLLSIRDGLLNDETFSLCKTTTREIDRRLDDGRTGIDELDCSGQIDGFDVSQRKLAQSTSIDSPSAFIIVSAKSEDIIIFRSSRYSWRKLMCERGYETNVEW
jgi:hypothetical protein